MKRKLSPEQEQRLIRDWDRRSNARALRVYAAGYNAWSDDQRASLIVAEHEAQCNERTRQVVASLNSASETT